MTTKRALVRIRIELVSSVLECGIAIATLGLIILAAPILLILAAQVERFATAGEWRGFQFSEFLEVIGVDPNSAAELSPVVPGVMEWPATLLLATAALALVLLIVVLGRANRRQRARITGLRQAALIEDIERKLKAQ